MGDTFPSSWVIDVCRTCGRKAEWPFCEHREQAPSDGRPWCLPVVVKGTLTPGNRLALTPESADETSPPGVREAAIVAHAAGRPALPVVRCGFGNSPDHRPHDFTITGEWPSAGPHRHCPGGPALTPEPTNERGDRG